MIPALAWIHLLANLIKFSTAKDGFMWGAEDGFYVYSQSGLGDLSKVCTSIRKEEGRKDEKEERLDKIYVLKVPNRAHGFYRRTNILKHGKPVYLNDEGTSLKSQFAYLFQRRRGPQKLLYSNKKIIILFPNL